MGDPAEGVLPHLAFGVFHPGIEEVVRAIAEDHDLERSGFACYRERALEDQVVVGNHREVVRDFARVLPRIDLFLRVGKAAPRLIAALPGARVLEIADQPGPAWGGRSFGRGRWTGGGGRNLQDNRWRLLEALRWHVHLQ